MRSIFYLAGLLVLCMNIASSAYALPGESIVLDPATGNYRVTYLNTDDNKFYTITFVPATKFTPVFKSEFKLDHRRDIHYRYDLRNDKHSKQDILSFIFDHVSSVTTPMPDIPLDTQSLLEGASLDPAKIMQLERDMDQAASYFDSPALWEPFMTYSRGRDSFRLGWGTKVRTALQPGKEAEKFGFKSRDLPGVILVEIRGIALNRQEIPAEELDPNDGGFGQQYAELESRNFIPRPAAVPTITISKPFDGVAVLRQLKEHVAKWPDLNMGDYPTWPHLKLIEPAAATTINNGLQAAMDELGAGKRDAAVRTLKSLRAQLEPLLSNGKHDSAKEKSKAGKDVKGKKDAHAEQEEASRHLAKEVLEFDLKYICRELGSDEKFDEGERH